MGKAVSEELYELADSMEGATADLLRTLALRAELQEKALAEYAVAHWLATKGGSDGEQG